MDRVCARLSTEYKNTDKVLRLDWMFASFAADAVIGYCFENQYHWIEGPDFRCGFVESINGLVDNVHLVSQFPWLARLLSAIPEELLAKVNPNMVAVKDFNNVSIMLYEIVIRSRFCRK